MKTIAEVAAEFGVGLHTVLNWIKRGELKAINVSRELGRKPQWRVTEAALEAFRVLRTPSPPIKKTVKKHSTKGVGVTEFYK